MAAVFENALCRLFRFPQRFLVNLFRAADVGVLAGQHLLVDRAHPLGGLDHVVISLPLAPIQLVHGPGREVRFLQLLDRAFAGLFGERVPGGREFLQRQLIELIDAVVQRSGHLLSLTQRHCSLSAEVFVNRRDFIASLAVTPASVSGAAADQAAGTRPAPASRPLSITLLGTGTPAPSLERQSSGYLIDIGTDLIVWDHGPGAHHRLIESGRRSIDVTHAFFTHLHYDHCMDYGRLVLQRWDQGAGRIPELQVYGPAPIARMTEQLFGENGIYAGDIAARTTHRSSLDVFEARGGTLPRLRPGPRVTEIHTGSVVEGNGWKITVAHAQHAQPYLECVALRLDTAEGSICYSGDSGGIAASVVQLAKGCDLFIAMNHFFSGTEPTPAFRLATGNHRDNAEIAKRAGG